MTEAEAEAEAQRRWGVGTKSIWDYDQSDDYEDARQGWCKERNGPNTYKDGKPEFVVGYWDLFVNSEEGGGGSWLEASHNELGVGDSWEAAFADADKKAGGTNGTN